MMFLVAGPVNPQRGLFFGRAAALAVMEEWLYDGNCVGAVAGARQTGKTSVLLQLAQRLEPKFRFVFVDLEVMAQAPDADCFGFICAEMVRQLHLTGVLPTPAMRPCDGVGFLEFLRQVAAIVGSVKIGVMLDEIGALTPETGTALAAAIRALFSSRHVCPEYARFVFILSGSTDIRRFATDKTSPIYNVTHRVYLPDLTYEEATALLNAGFAGLDPQPTDEVRRRILYWTNGHPYLTQLLGKQVAAAWGKAEFKAAVRQVDTLVEALLQEEDCNLPHLRRAMDKVSSRGQQIVARVLAGETIRFSRSDEDLAELELAGALAAPGGSCVVRNRIYERALAEWLQQHPDLYPARPQGKRGLRVVLRDLVPRLSAAQKAALGTTALSLALSLITNWLDRPNWLPEWPLWLVATVGIGAFLILTVRRGRED